MEDILLKIDRILQPARRCAVILEDSVMNAVDSKLLDTTIQKDGLKFLLGLSQRLGVGTLCVGSDALYRLVWLGGLCGGPSLSSVFFV